MQYKNITHCSTVFFKVPIQHLPPQQNIPQQAPYHQQQQQQQQHIQPQQQVNQPQQQVNQPQQQVNQPQQQQPNQQQRQQSVVMNAFNIFVCLVKYLNLLLYSNYSKLV